MAEKTKTKTESKGGGKTKTKKHRLRAITTHQADDGSFVHEHHHVDEEGNQLPPTYGGVSSDMADLHQHMEDAFNPQGPGADQAAGGDEGAGEATAGAEPQPGQ